MEFPGIFINDFTPLCRLLKDYDGSFHRHILFLQGRSCAVSFLSSPCWGGLYTQIKWPFGRLCVHCRATSDLGVAVVSDLIATHRGLEHEICVLNQAPESSGLSAYIVSWSGLQISIILLYSASQASLVAAWQPQHMTCCRFEEPSVLRLTNVKFRHTDTS
jgi:hypothetical protein